MRTRLVASIAALILAGSAVAALGQTVAPSPTPAAAYCTPLPVPMTPGLAANAAYFAADFAFAATCPGQYGDVLTDGPFFASSFTPSAFTFTVPANMWVALGMRVPTVATSFTATASSTNYVYLNASTGVLSISTSAVVPGSSILAYTVVTDGSGVTSTTYPVPSQWRIPLGTIATTLQARGARCDGTTDDSAVINAPGFPVSIPNNQNCFANEAVSALPTGYFWSSAGHLITFDSSAQHARARQTATIKVAPSYTGPETDIIHAFDGNFTNTIMPWETFIGGASTLGTPSSTYQYNPAVTPFFGFFYNQSGYQQWPYGGVGVGRTGATAFRTHVYQHGNGDAAAYNCQGFDDHAGLPVSPSPIPTRFQGASAVICFNGDVQAGQNSVFLNPVEIHAEDAGFDVTAVGFVYNPNRSNATGALGTIWEGYTVQSLGSAKIDAAYTARGPMTIGIDLSSLNYATPSPAPAIAIKAGDYVAWNAVNTDATHYSRYTAPGNTTTGYNATSAALEVTVGGTLVQQFKSGQSGELSCTPSAARFCTATATVLSGSRCVASFDLADTAATIDNWQYVAAKVVTTTLTIRMETTDSESALLAADYKCGPQ